MSARRGRPAALLALVLVLACVAGCAAFPTSGDVHQGTTRVPEPGPVFLGTPDSPRQDATPVEIVRGFVDALAQGVSDDFTVAREFLAPQASGWDPWASASVYSGEPNLTGGPVGHADDAGDAPAARPTAGARAVVHGELAVLASVSGDGQFSEEPTGTHKELQFVLRADTDGQWRIAQLDDGIAMSGANFSSVYRSVDVYFPTVDHKLLVPDVRWFPQSTSAAQAVKAVLAGPPAWLRDAVDNVVPDGTELSVDSVPVDEDGTATVDLTAAARAASGTDRAVLVQQLDTVLLQFPRVQSVEVLAAGSALSVTASPPLAVDPDPGAGPYALSGRSVRTLASGKPEPVDGTASAATTPTALAVGAGGRKVVVREGTDRLTLLTGTKPRTLLTGTHLAEPSVDRFGWTWTASTGVDGALLAVQDSGDPKTVTGTWLAGRRVETVAVSRDGARVLVVSSGGTGAQVDLAGIVRNDAGAPVRLTDPLSVGAALADVEQAVWVDEDTAAVLGHISAASGATVALVPVGGFTRQLSPINDVVSIAAGHGERSLFAATSDGTLWQRSTTGASWSTVAADVRSPAFPG